MKPHYPIVYTIVHFQNAEALIRIDNAMGNVRMVRFGHYMTVAGIQHLWSGDHFVSAIDEDGVIDPPSDDSLHSLLYISPNSLPSGYVQAILEYSRQLETPAGYRAGIPLSQDIKPIPYESVDTLTGNTTRRWCQI